MLFATVCATIVAVMLTASVNAQSNSNGMCEWTEQLSCLTYFAEKNWDYTAICRDYKRGNGGDCPLCWAAQYGCPYVAAAAGDGSLTLLTGAEPSEDAVLMRVVGKGSGPQGPLTPNPNSYGFGYPAPETWSVTNVGIVAVVAMLVVMNMLFFVALLRGGALSGASSRRTKYYDGVRSSGSDSE